MFKVVYVARTGEAKKSHDELGFYTYYRPDGDDLWDKKP